MKAICVVMGVLLYTTVTYIFDRVFAERATAFEEVLGTRWRCRFLVIFSEARICGTYRDRTIQVITARSFFFTRSYRFELMCPELPAEKRFLLTYPHVGPQVYRQQNKLVAGRYGPCLGRGPGVTKAEIAETLDELIQMAEEAAH